MAINIPIISDFTDKGIKDAKIAFQNFKTSVANAEGGMDKFKAGSTAAMDYVKQNAATFAAGAASSIATFSIASINAFQDVALKAGEFATKTGISLDEASRWIEVAGDLGVDADSVAGAVDKMNKYLGSNPDLVKALGDDIAYTNTGTIDVNDTFLKLIDRLKGIKDPTDRAKEGAKLFGKAWTDVSLLIEQGSEKILDRFKEVSDAKLITPEELQRARDFRDFMDNIQDKGKDLAITYGGELVKSISNWEVAGRTAEASGRVGFDKLMTQAVLFGTITVGEWFGIEQAARVSFSNVANQILPIRDRIREVESAAQDTGTAFEDMKYQWDLLSADIRGDMAVRDLERQMSDMREAAGKAFGGTRDDLLEYQDAVDKTKLDMIKLSETFPLLDQKKLQILIDRGDLEAAWDLIQRIASGVGKTLPGGDTLRTGLVGARAVGGPTVANAPYLVGENGPELFYPRTNGTIAPTAGGGNITVNVNGGDPNAIVRALQQYVRQSGPVPVNTRAM